MSLAELPPPDPAFFWQWLLSAAAIVWIVGSLVRMKRDLRGSQMVSPQPFLVQAAEQFATKEELGRLATDMEKLESTVEKLAGMMRAGENDLHNRVTQTQTNVAEMKGTMDGHTQLLSRMENKLDRALTRASS